MSSTPDQSDEIELFVTPNDIVSEKTDTKIDFKPRYTGIKRQLYHSYSRENIESESENKKRRTDQNYQSKIDNSIASILPLMTPSLKNKIQDDVILLFFLDYIKLSNYSNVKVLSPTAWNFLYKLTSNENTQNPDLNYSPNEATWEKNLMLAVKSCPKLNFNKNQFLVCPTNVKRNHWILLVAAIKEPVMSITILDSYDNTSTTEESYLKQTRLLSLLINKVYQCDYKTGSTLLKEYSQKIFVPKLTKPPQQGVSNACGAYICYYLVMALQCLKDFNNPGNINLTNGNCIIQGQFCLTTIISFQKMKYQIICLQKNKI